MEWIDVPTIHGVKKECVYNVKDFPYKKQFDCETVRVRKNTILNIPCAFDIEANTIIPPDWKPGKVNKTAPYGYMYHWQLCIVEDVVFGRTWEEFTYFINRIRAELSLNQNKKLIIYVHNLAYEFQFMYNFLEITSLFAKDKRKPLKVGIDGIEFRCSYFLSNMSLSKFCENSSLCYHYKMDGDDYDYTKLRTPETEMTEKEKGYCYNDVRGLCECILSYMEHDTLATIPLTNTGFVRREYRHNMQTEYNRKVFEKTALNASEYTMMQDNFRGGNTHANRFLVNKILENVGSHDIQSSYPAAIMLDYFPIGKFSEITLDSQEKLLKYCNEFCVIMKVSFFNIIAKQNNVVPYIPISKCTKISNVVNDNGRVLQSNFIEITINEIDLEIIRNTYNYEGFTVHKAIAAKRGKLPSELRTTLKSFFEAKTKLKGIDGKEYEYMKSKNRINSTYGMMVTDIAHNEILFTDGWNIVHPELEKSLEQYYKSRNNFLSYQWGVYVTSHARRRLQEMIDIVGTDLVYVDTDSIKYIGDHRKDFEIKNTEILKQCEAQDIPAYIEHNNKKVYLGIWEDEGKGDICYSKFKTLGAKKYCYEQNGKFKITVSGMDKKKGAKAVGSIENFNIGKTYKNVGRTTSFYNDEPIHKITVNGCTFTTASNIGIVDTTYTLGITMEYWNLIFDNK